MRRTLFAIGAATLLMTTVIAAPASAATDFYGGNPVIDRPELDSYTNFIIVDRNNPIEANGVLYRWSFWAGRLKGAQLVIVRDVGGTKTVVATSEVVTPSALGATTRTLANLPVKAGDWVGLYFAENGVVPFSGTNAAGTAGVVLYTSNGSGDADVGDTLTFEGATPRMYSVRVTGSFRYDYEGFFQPVDNANMNVTKAGSAIPVKFSLGGNEGLDIFKDGFPKSINIGCETGEPPDPIEETVTAGQSSLSYDADTARYTYVWKTQKAWEGTCRRFQLGLADDSNHTFDVKFK